MRLSFVLYFSSTNNFYNSFFKFSPHLRSSWEASSNQISTRSNIRTFMCKVFFLSPISIQFRTFPNRVVFSADFLREKYGNIVPILLGNSAKFRRKDFRTFENFKFVYQNNFLSQHFYFRNSKDNTVTFSPNKDLVIQNFDFELIIGYFELSKSQFKAVNLHQDIFQDKRSKFQVIKVEILTCKSQLSKCWVIKVKKMFNYNGRYYFETHINV